jgi:thioredoxin-like negative regulator of GroEL
LRGREAAKRGAVDEAEREFGAAVELSPDFAEARVGHALALVRSDPPRAAESLRQGLARAPRPNARRLLLVALGDVLLVAGDFPAAEQAWSEASLYGPTLRLHDRLARLRSRTGRFAEAFAEFLAAARE